MYQINLILEWQTTFFLYIFADRASQYIYLNIKQLDALRFYNEFISRLNMFRAHVLIARRPKIVLYSLWCHHTYRWPSRAQVERGTTSCTKFYNEFISRLNMFRAHVLIVRRSKLYYRASGIITPIGGRPVHGTWNKLIIKFSASSWLILR